MRNILCSDDQNINKYICIYIYILFLNDKLQCIVVCFHQLQTVFSQKRSLNDETVDSDKLILVFRLKIESDSN